MLKSCAKLFIPLAVSVSLASCGTRIDSMQETIKTGILGKPDVVLTPDEIAEQKYPMQYLTLSGQARISVALGFDDKGLYKWLSGSKEVLVTRSGRIVQTQELTINGNEKDLEWVSNLKYDPLACMATSQQNCPTNWVAQVQVGNGLDAKTIDIHSQFSNKGEEVLQAPDGSQLQTTKWLETVTNGDEVWSNWYWLEEDTHRVVKSEQQLSPAFPSIKLEEVKPYSKDLQQGRAN